MTIAHIPFRYPAQVVLPRRRNSETIFVRGEIIVDIPEISSAEAPIALVIRDRDHPSQAKEYRAYKGVPVLPIAGPHGYGASTFKSEDLVPLLSRFTDGGVETSAWPDFPFFLGTEEKPLDQMPIRQIVSSQHDEYREYALIEARHFVAIDGVLYKHLHEPFWSVFQDARWEGNGLDGPPQKFVRISLRTDNRETANGSVFRGDRLKDAQAYALQFARSLGDNVLVERKVELEDRGLVMWSRDDIGTTVRDLLHQLHWTIREQEGSFDLPDEFFGPWLRLRKEQRAVRSGAPFSVNEAIDAMREIRSIVDAVDPGAEKISASLKRALDPLLWRVDNLDQPYLAAPDDDAAALADFRP